MNRKLFNSRLCWLLASAVIIASMLSFPQSVLAWAAIKSDMWVKGDLDTHQKMLHAAYYFLSQDPAFKTNPNMFPKEEEIMRHEGVKAEWAVEGYISGAKSIGGPDAGGVSRESEHYYNTETAEGDALSSVRLHYSALLNYLYNKASSLTSSSQGVKGAAWAAHYLADLFVPYHVVGVPASRVRNNNVDILGDPSLGILSKKEAGDDILWNSSVPIYIYSGWGNNGNFSEAMKVFNDFRASDKNTKDWFDPWYYNGRFLNNARIAFGSHAAWEDWAHNYIGGLYPIPTIYSTDWENIKPSFDYSFSRRLEEQEVKAVDFTRRQAAETRENTANYLNSPQLAANKAITAIATLWRASISALKPKAKVEPIGPKGSNRYKVLGTVSVPYGYSSLPVELSHISKKVSVVSNVQAKLTIEGASIINSSNKREDIKRVDLKKVLGDIPYEEGEISWEIETTDINKCQIKMEVIGEFGNYPDLGYAVAIAEKPRSLTVTVSPDQVDPKKFTLSVTISPPPPQKTKLEIRNWEPFNVVPWPITTEANGKFTKVCTLKDGVLDGEYEIKVEAPQLNIPPGTAKFRVGKQATIDLSRLKNCTFAYNVYGYVRNSDSTIGSWSGTSGTYWFKGSFTGNEFNGVLDPEAKGFENKGGSGTIKITVIPTPDPTIFEITGYTIQTSRPWVDSGTLVTNLSAEKISIKAKYNELFYKFDFGVPRTDTCKYITRFRETRTYIVYGQKGSTICEEIKCDNIGARIGFTFFEPLR